MRIRLVGLFIFLASAALAQEITIKGAFVNDSIRVGEPVYYWLTADYPSNVDLFLPDSTFDSRLTLCSICGCRVWSTAKRIR